MKIRKLTLLAAVVVFTLSSCEKIKDIAAVDVDTELNTDIDLESMEAVALKSTSLAENYDLSGSGSIDLSENSDVKDYIDGFRSITPSDPTYTLTGLEAGNTITGLTVTATVGDDAYKIIDNKTVTSAALTGDLNDVVQLMDSWDLNGWGSVVNFEVSGKSDFDVNNKVKLKLSIPATVRYSPL